ncbi:MAG: hypothetical protein E6R03_14940, partial [Hyphomicrobiaceae bacterium]
MEFRNLKIPPCTAKRLGGIVKSHKGTMSKSAILAAIITSAVTNVARGVALPDPVEMEPGNFRQVNFRIDGATYERFVNLCPFVNGRAVVGPVFAAL